MERSTVQDPLGPGRRGRSPRVESGVVRPVEGWTCPPLVPPEPVLRDTNGSWVSLCLSVGVGSVYHRCASPVPPGRGGGVCRDPETLSRSCSCRTGSSVLPSLEEGRRRSEPKRPLLSPDERPISPAPVSLFRSLVLVQRLCHVAVVTSCP